ncbi:uncharacterized protein LOC141606741 isoform X2 [Silene latifolia]|uniref:uncharacterized protein LOC141606741 isoform X2 n=1 Tax=Silene latifolia TaxID=37657 RepID=UPI003D771EBD
MNAHDSETISQDNNDGRAEESAQGASAFLQEQQQQTPTPPNKEDHSESRCAVTESKAAITSSIVLKKLLRRTRYFDSGSSCLEDRAAVCRTQKRRKVCYLCGQLLHDAKKCPKRRPCYSCKRKGHYAIDCPMNINESERICLKCGETGHEISSCNNDYCPEDVKKIHCYVCNELGHIYCGNLIDENMPTVSCYNCGESGHSGLQCPKPLIDKSGSKPPSICYKCGEEGHAARRCVNSFEPSKCNEGSQGGTLHIRPEIDNGDEQQKNKRGRKSFRNGRIRRQKWKELVDQHAGIIQ